MIHYLDTSALVKLYVYEPGALAVRGLVKARHDLAVSWIGHAEARAALARLAREGRLTARALRRCVRKLDEDFTNLAGVEATVTICRAAGGLAERHALRGFDAVHLACAIHLRDALGEQPTFVAFDARLVAAARAEGFPILPP